MRVLFSLLFISACSFPPILFYFPSWTVSSFPSQLQEGKSEVEDSDKEQETDSSIYQPLINNNNQEEAAAAAAMENPKPPSKQMEYPEELSNYSARDHRRWDRDRERDRYMSSSRMFSDSGRDRMRSHYASGLGSVVVKGEERGFDREWERPEYNYGGRRGRGFLGAANNNNNNNMAAPARAEVRDGDYESQSDSQCRICLDYDPQGEKLISPCQCRGSHQFVHRSCLDQWRSVKEGFAFAHCTTCRAQYHLRIDFLECACWRNTKFHMFVTRDILLVFLAIQTIVTLLGGIAYLCDLNGSFRKAIGQGWDHIFSDHPLLFYYCIGALVFLVLLGIFGLVFQCVTYSGGRSSHYDESHGYNTNAIQPVYCCNGPCFIDCSDSDPGGELVVLLLIFIIIFATIGLFYGIFAGTVGIQRIWQRHHHILVKRELTKEYIVEDLHGHYTLPRLDPEHTERLRDLNLL